MSWRSEWAPEDTGGPGPDKSKELGREAGGEVVGGRRDDESYSTRIYCRRYTTVLTTSRPALGTSVVISSGCWLLPIWMYSWFPRTV